VDQSNSKNYLKSERDYFLRCQDYFLDSSGSFTEKSHAFSWFIPRQSIICFLARNEAYQKILDVHGSNLDFGVYRGASLFTWLHLSSIYEPYNHMRKVIGFDSFQGFSELGVEDFGTEGSDLALKHQGGIAYEGAEELREGIDLLDLNRPLGHVSKGLVWSAVAFSCLNT